MAFLAPLPEHRIGNHPREMDGGNVRHSAQYQHVPTSHLPTGPLAVYPTEEQGLFNCVFAKGPCDAVNQAIQHSLINNSPVVGMMVQVGAFSVEPLVINLREFAQTHLTYWGRSSENAVQLLRGVVDPRTMDRGVLNRLNADEVIREILSNINSMSRGPGKIWVRNSESGEVVGYNVYTYYGRSSIRETVQTQTASKAEVGHYPFLYRRYLGRAEDRLWDIEHQMQNGVRR